MSSSGCLLRRLGTHLPRRRQFFFIALHLYRCRHLPRNPDSHTPFLPLQPHRIERSKWSAKRRSERHRDIYSRVTKMSYSRPAADNSVFARSTVFLPKRREISSFGTERVASFPGTELVRNCRSWGGPRRLSLGLIRAIASRYPALLYAGLAAASASLCPHLARFSLPSPRAAAAIASREISNSPAFD